MLVPKKKEAFFESETGNNIKKQLQAMEADERYNTSESYSASSANLSNSLISFTRKHMLYLDKHRNLDPTHYLANLRLKTKARRQSKH